MWPALAKQGASRKVEVPDFTCVVVEINMTNAL